MRKLLIILSLTIFTTCLVCCDQSVQMNQQVNEKSNEVQQQNQNFESNPNSIKTKRGIHGFAGLRYLPPAYSGVNYIRHTPYSSFPGRIYTRPAGPSYTLAPGNAVVHSYNANFPRVLYPRPVLRPALPAPPVPVYTHRYPVFVQKPFVVPKPIVPLPPVTQFAVPNFLSTIPSPHVHSAHPVPVPVPFPLQGGVGVLPQSTIISQNGWKPFYSSIPSSSTVPSLFPSHSHLNLASPSHPHRPSNYYLPADPLPAHDIPAHAHSTHDALSHENGVYTEFFFM